MAFDEDMQAKTQAAIMAVWTANRPVYLARVDQLGQAADACIAGTLSVPERDSAFDVAHKVAGAVGTFGYARASTLAKEMELLLQGQLPLTVEQGERLKAIAAELRRELETEPRH